MKWINELKPTLTPVNVKTRVPAPEFFSRNNRKVPGAIAFVQTEELKDNESFIKVYIKGINLLFDLTMTAQSVLQVVLFLARSKKDTNRIALNYAIAQEYGYMFSRSNFSNGIKELVEKDIIQKEVHPIYLYNLNLFFNGNRIAFVNEYTFKEVKSKSKDRDSIGEIK